MSPNSNCCAVSAKQFPVAACLAPYAKNVGLFRVPNNDELPRKKRSAVYAANQNAIDAKTKKTDANQRPFFLSTTNIYGLPKKFLTAISNSINGVMIAYNTIVKLNAAANNAAMLAETIPNTNRMRSIS